MPEISIIVRTKNEESWIGHCLEMIYEQDFKSFEVILVDNASSDNTIQIAKRFPVDLILNIDKFLPGKALNKGILASSGNYIVCISAHCIPKNIDWLSTLYKNFESDEQLAGVYGRQLPLSYTSDVDKRDLLIVFGRDRRTQMKDYFFHNANSMLRRDIWEKFPFDEVVTNIEDRVWGKAVVSAGYHIVYDPDAAVYHYHGLHQENTKGRARGVVSIIEQIDQDVTNALPNSLKPEVANIVAIIPFQGKIKLGTKDYKLLLKAIIELKQSKYVKKIYLVSIEGEFSKQFEIEWIDRSTIADEDTLALDHLLQKCLESIESTGEFPQSVLYVNYDYLNRPEHIFDELIFDAQYKGYDTVFSGYLDYKHYWLKNENDDYHQTDDSMKARSDMQPVYRALYGLGCLTSSAIVRKGKIIGGKIGILPIQDFNATLRLRDFENPTNDDQTISLKALSNILLEISK
ncbi:glycosyltransferase [Candidatus Pseudothioglobus singularis]|nr:glycosyltransferase [Candidatus Pseudothioglobus singularis]